MSHERSAALLCAGSLRTPLPVVVDFCYYFWYPPRHMALGCPLPLENSSRHRTCCALQATLKNISFRVEPGQSIALVGSSGRWDGRARARFCVFVRLHVRACVWSCVCVFSVYRYTLSWPHALRDCSFSPFFKAHAWRCLDATVPSIVQRQVDHHAASLPVLRRERRADSW